jgi:hypothetical protein
LNIHARIFLALGLWFVSVVLGCSNDNEAAADQWGDDTLSGSEVVGSNEVSNSDGAKLPDTTPPPTGIRYGYLAVHLDPGGSSTAPGTSEPNPSRGIEYFANLVALVEAADIGKHKLTLMFTAQWAAHVLSPTCELPGAVDSSLYTYRDTEVVTCLELVRAFESYGHEVSFHHHPKGVKASWDGFTNDPPPHPPGYLGSVDDLMAWGAQIPVGGIDTVRSGTLEEDPALHSIRFTGARGPTPYIGAEDLGDLVSQPCAWLENGNAVWRFRMRTYTKGFADIRAEAAAAYTDLREVPGPWTIGFVTHAKDVDGALGEYETLFSWLSESEIQLEGLSSVAARYDWTANTPRADGPRACPEDEAL